MAIGLDTSVVVRLLVGEPVRQYQRARQRLEQAMDEGEVILVTDLVLAEAYYALHYHYDVPKAEARHTLRDLARSGVVVVEPAGVLRALDHEGGAGLVDRWIHERYRSLGAVTLTFEQRQGGLEGAVRLR